MDMLHVPAEALLSSIERPSVTAGGRRACRGHHPDLVRDRHHAAFERRRASGWASAVWTGRPIKVSRGRGVALRPPSFTAGVAEARGRDAVRRRRPPLSRTWPTRSARLTPIADGAQGAHILEATRLYASAATGRTSPPLVLRWLRRVAGLAESTCSTSPIRTKRIFGLADQEPMDLCSTPIPSRRSFKAALDLAVKTGCTGIYRRRGSLGATCASTTSG
jgi:hypothetical protein